MVRVNENRNIDESPDDEDPMSIDDEDELGEALANDEETIVIEGDLRKKVLRIKATGKTAWIVAIGAIGVAVTALLVSAGTAAPVSGLIAGAAFSTLGASTATSAIAIAVAAGGVAALNKLRSYKIDSDDGDKLVLKK